MSNKRLWTAFDKPPNRFWMSWPRLGREVSSSKLYSPANIRMNAQKRVLLVDDDRAIVDDKPDAIVMDIRMPRKDGMTALAELQQNSATRDIPVIVLSASLRDQQRALDAGARFFLPKPYHGKNLLAAVSTALEEQQTPGPGLKGSS